MDDVKPLVPVSDGLGSAREMLVVVAGTVVNMAILATVAGVIIGAILVGLGTAFQRPELGRRGIETLVGGVVCAIVAAGLSAWIAWFADEAIRMWH